MFYIMELFDDEVRFEEMLNRKDSQSLSSTDSESEGLLNKSGGSAGGSDEDDEDVMTMDRVRFNSLCILPS